MDRSLPEAVVQQRKNKGILWGGAIVLALLAGVWGLRSGLSTTFKRSELRFSVAETGPVENTLIASGEILPEFEQLLSSPLNSVIQTVYLNEGAAVKAGDKILELDKALAQIDLEKQKDALELKRNGIVKTKLELDKSFFDLQINDSIKAFRIAALKADIENAKRLFKAGGGTREAVERLENDLHIAQLEKRQLENDIRSRQAVMRASIRETEITATISEKELKTFEEKLKKADLRAAHAGVITYVNKNLGQKVIEGEPLARVADLGTYKVMGSISDNYTDQISVGMPVIIRLNGSDLRGVLTNIYPSVANNVLRFEVAPDHKNAAEFRPKMKVELFLVTDRRAQTVRVANGPTFRGGTEQEVFVLRPDGNTAERRRVKIGLVNFDHVEIAEGVSAGETVIISDLNKYKNTNTLTIQQ